MSKQDIQINFKYSIRVVAYINTDSIRYPMPTNGNNYKHRGLSAEHALGNPIQNTDEFNLVEYQFLFNN